MVFFMFKAAVLIDGAPPRVSLRNERRATPSARVFLDFPPLAGTDDVRVSSVVGVRWEGCKGGLEWCCQRLVDFN